MKEFFMTDQELYHDGQQGSADASSEEDSIYDEGSIHDPERGELSPGKRRILVRNSHSFGTRLISKAKLSIAVYSRLHQHPHVLMGGRFNVMCMIFQ
jgi:hypothetical protein